MNRIRIIVRFALWNISRGTMGYFASQISYAKKTMMRKMPRQNGTRTRMLFHEANFDFVC